MTEVGINTRTGLPRRRGGFPDLIVRLFREKPLGAAGAAICILMLLVAAFADVIAPDSYNQINPVDRLKAPSWQYWFGTDHLGRDVFARIVHGAQISVEIAFAAAGLSTLISTVIAGTSGYMGGRVDLSVQRFVDGWMALPDLLVLIVAVSVLQPGKSTIILVLSLLLGINGSRIIRGAVLSVKENVYVRAARSIGASIPRIICVHILPNVLPVIIVLFTARLGVVILAEASLGFLGLGIPPPAPSWGAMLGVEGRSYMFKAPWLAIAPGIALTVVVFGIFAFGDAVRDLIDPRNRGGNGHYLGRVRRGSEAKS